MQTDSTTLSGKGIKLENFKEVYKGSVLYQFDLYIAAVGLTIRSCKFIQAGSNKFISFPSKEYEKDGEKKYYSYGIMEKDRKDNLDKLVIDLINEKYKPQSK